jgi:hypothetical protein
MRTGVLTTDGGDRLSGSDLRRNDITSFNSSSIYYISSM